MKRALSFFAALVSAVVYLAAGAQATAVKAQHVTVDLISEQRTIQPQSPFTLGLSFSIEPGWHLYWVNPGDAGLAPSVRWTLPAEISAGDIEWPYPERTQIQSIVNYVYSGDVLLPVTMLAGDLHGKSAAITAEVKWLVCKDVCIPGKATLNLDLPIAHESQIDPAQKAAFAETRAKIPKPLPNPVSMVDVGQQFIIQVERLRLDAPAEFFPLAPNQVDNSVAPRIISMGNGMNIYLKKSDQLLKPIQHLSGVLLLNDGRSFTVNAPLESPNKKRK